VVASGVEDAVVVTVVAVGEQPVTVEHVPVTSVVVVLPAELIP